MLFDHIPPLPYSPPPSPPPEFVSMNSELTLDLWNLIIVWNLVSGRYRGVYFSTFSGVLQVFISFLIKWTIEEISCDSPVTCQTLQYKLLELKQLMLQVLITLPMQKRDWNISRLLRILRPLTRGQARFVIRDLLTVISNYNSQNFKFLLKKILIKNKL